MHQEQQHLLVGPVRVFDLVVGLVRRGGRSMTLDPALALGLAFAAGFTQVFSP